jgi:transketolase
LNKSHRQTGDDAEPDGALKAEFDSIAFARAARQAALRMTHHAKASHIGSCFSAADVMAVLYGRFLRINPKDPAWPERDRFILSKGHAAAILYASLALRGFFPMDWLDRYCDNGQPLAGHVMASGVPGVEVSTGSLGHGLSIGLGMALGVCRDRQAGRVVVMLSDGECDEGSVWEAMLFAGHRSVSNLIAIVDYNKIQSLGNVQTVLDLAPFAEKWRACRWHVQEIDGHDHSAIERALIATAESAAPSVILAHTIKGRGVSFMENRLLWHYRSVNDQELAAALKETDR